MQDAPISLQEGTLQSATQATEQTYSPIIKFRYYTRLLVGHCLLLWLLSFLAYLAAEWLHTQRQPSYLEVVPRPPHALTSLLRGSGAFATLAGAGGWWGSLHQRHAALFTFSSIIFITSVLEISCSAVTLSYAGKTTLLMNSDLMKEFEQVKGADTNISTDKFTELQEIFHCCGVHTYQDWIDSPWWKEQRRLNSSLVVPVSCCAGTFQDRQCNVGSPPFREVSNASLLHSIGCMKRVSEYMNLLFYTTGSLAFTGGFLKFSGFFILHFLIIMMLRHQRQTSEIYEDSNETGV